ncbi:MAG: helix-turn-helix transcriptional regulator [Terracidiphilus sp.]|jgi:DNA-binding transcriptional regulator YiaG
MNIDAAQIREWREARVLSQEALARSLGVAVRTVARWESGAYKPSPLAAARLEQALANNQQPEGDPAKGVELWR